MKDINLIPKSYFKEKKKKKFKFYIINIAVIAVLIVSMAFIIPINRYLKYKNRLDDIIKKADETSGYFEKTKLLDEFYSIYDKRKDIAFNILNYDNEELEVFNRIEKSRPENIFIMNYKMTGESINDRVLIITCISESEDEVIVFLGNLRKDIFFKEAVLTSINIMSSENQTDNENEKNDFNNKFTSTVELYY